MSAREWTPGDVALAYDKDWAFRVVRHHGSPDYWSAANGEWPRGVSGELLDYRPLVVIDPDSRRDIERLRDWYDVEVISQNSDPDPRDVTPAERANALQAALREFANPTPRIEEPTGLGAVVEDDRGCRWVKVDTAMSCDSWTEADAGMSDNPWRKYASLNAVRVLSEGVSS